MNGTFICQLNYLFELVWEWVCFTGSTVAAFIKWSEATFYLLVCGLLLCFVSEFLTRLINHPSLNFQELEQCVFLVRTRFGTGFNKSAIQNAPIFHLAILSFCCHFFCNWVHTVLQAVSRKLSVTHDSSLGACPFPPPANPPDRCLSPSSWRSGFHFFQFLSGGWALWWDLKQLRLPSHTVAFRQPAYVAATVSGTSSGRGETIRLGRSANSLLLGRCILLSVSWTFFSCRSPSCSFPENTQMSAFCTFLHKCLDQKHVPYPILQCSIALFWSWFSKVLTRSL